MDLQYLSAQKINILYQMLEFETDTLVSNLEPQKYLKSQVYGFCMVSYEPS